MLVLDTLPVHLESSATIATNSSSSSNSKWRSRFQADLRQFSWNGIFMDGACCCRHHDSPSSFDIQDPNTDRIIDIPASFAPTGISVVLWKLIVTASIASVIIIGITSNIRKGLVGGYLTFFSNWGTIFSLFYMLTSFISSAFAKWGMVCQPTLPDDSKRSTQQLLYPNLWTRFTWAQFAIAAHTELSITLIFWFYILVVDSEPKWARIDLSLLVRHYQDIMTHGVIGILILIDGLVVNRIPLRLAHGWQFVVWIYLLYMVWIPINASLMSKGVFYQKFMTRDFSGRLAPIQDPSPRFIYTALVLHVITGALVLCYGYVVRRRLPSWLAYFGKLVICCDLIALIWPAMYELFGRQLEYCIGKGLLGFIILFGWCPILQIILFTFSDWSRKRYLPVNVPNVDDPNDI